MSNPLFEYQIFQKHIISVCWNSAFDFQIVYNCETPVWIVKENIHEYIDKMNS